MCCSCEQKKLKCWGMIFMIAFIVGAVICIILAGINFDITNFQWSKTNWASLGTVQLAAIIYVFVTCGVGFFAFCCANICLIVIFLILLAASMLFTFAIAIFGLVGGSVTKVNAYIGCNSSYSGLLAAWQTVDSYLTQVDSTLCSSSCPCYFSNPVPYVTNTTIAPYYAQWTTTGVAGTGATKFQDCSTVAQQTAYNTYSSSNTGNSSDYLVKQDTFASYFKVLEQRFNCTGFCTTSYTNQYTGSKMVMYKYLFSDINVGPPLYLGCLNTVTEWLPPILQAFGVIALVVSFCEVVVFLMAFSLCYAKKKENAKNQQ